MVRETSKLLFFNVNNMDFPESSLDWMKKPLTPDLQERIVHLITDCSQSSDIICDNELFCPAFFQDLQVLRGLLAHDVLIHCLKLRHSVDYGVVPNHRTLMAIPFQAANLPKLRSEFAQPDIAIILTVLSYYNTGLTRDQVIETVTKLLSAGKSVQRRVYKEVFDLCKNANTELVSIDILSTIDTIEKLDIKNETQVSLLYNLYRKNMLFINFWLGHVLFPTATMVFPKKLTASSWNLTDCQKSSLQCGFSGTDDACLLLPHPLSYDPPDDPSILATNGKMLGHLIKKATYCSLHSLPEVGKFNECIGHKPLRVLKDHSNDINESILLDNLADLVNANDADAFIDAGALLCNYPLDQVAKFFLSRVKDKFKGVVYFSTRKCGWRVIDRKPCETSLKSSSILESDAFVIYDQSRCRGADMKLRPDAKAILSIGPCQQKDSLMQAAGRLRQLDFGQTIIATTTPNVELMIKDCLGLSKDCILTMEHVVSYALYNSVEATGNSMKHWCSQGMRFLRFLNNPDSILEEELNGLEALYYASDEKCTLAANVIPKLESIHVDCPNFSKTSSEVFNILKTKVKHLGSDVATSCFAGFEECERELEQEREKENEKEKELLQMRPFVENDWDYIKMFTSDSPRSIHFLDEKPLSATEFFRSRFLSDRARAICSTIHWDVSKIYFTSNYIRPLIETHHYDDYLRPVRMIIFFPKNSEILVVSELEAENLWRCLILGTAKLHRESPVLCGINFLSAANAGNSPVISLTSSPSTLLTVSHTALSLFNGQTSFNQKGQEALENELLLNKEAASGASFICISRGFRTMYQGSDLEKSCTNVLQYLHEKNKSE